MTSNALDYKQRIKQNSTSAEAYTGRKLKKNKAEMDLVRKGFAFCGGVKTALDAPCGVGRATILLASMGFEATGIDLGEGAVEVAQREVDQSGQTATVEVGNLEELKYPEDSFDALLCFRFYHHLPNDEIRQRVVSELCRVAKEYVLISYFSVYSYTSIKRLIRQKLKIKKSIQNATTLDSVSEKFNQCGFELVKDIPQQRFLHTLHLAVYKRSVG